MTGYARLCSPLLGLVTLEQMKEKRESLVKERERQLAAALAAAKRCALYGIHQ